MKNWSRVVGVSIASIALIAICLTGYERYTFANRELSESACRGALMMVGKCLKEHVNAHGGLLPAGGSGLGNVPGWRVVLEQQATQNLSTECAYNSSLNWNSEENLEVALNGSQVPFCWSMPDKSLTRFIALFGPEMAFNRGTPVAIDAIEDGAANTVLLVEFERSIFRWTEPEEISLDRLKCNLDLELENGNRPALLFADFEVYRINRPMSYHVFHALFTIRGCDGVSRRELVRDTVLVRGG